MSYEYAQNAELPSQIKTSTPRKTLDTLNDKVDALKDINTRLQHILENFGQSFDLPPVNARAEISPKIPYLLSLENLDCELNSLRANLETLEMYV